MSEEEKVAIVACAGMDKPLGSVARACAFKVVEDLKPEDSVLVCIPPLVAGVKPHSEWIKKYPIITIDGCDKRCAEVGTKKYSGKPVATIVVSEIMKKYPPLKAKSRDKLSAEEKELALKVAEEIATKVDEVLGRKE